MQQPHRALAYADGAHQHQQQEEAVPGLDHRPPGQGQGQDALVPPGHLVIGKGGQGQYQQDHLQKAQSKGDGQGADRPHDQIEQHQKQIGLQPLPHDKNILQDQTGHRASPLSINTIMSSKDSGSASSWGYFR